MQKLQDIQRAVELLSACQGPARNIDEAAKHRYQFWDTQPVPKLSKLLCLPDPSKAALSTNEQQQQKTPHKTHFTYITCFIPQIRNWRKILPFLRYKYWVVTLAFSHKNFSLISSLAKNPVSPHLKHRCFKSTYKIGSLLHPPFLGAELNGVVVPTRKFFAATHLSCSERHGKFAPFDLTDVGRPCCGTVGFWTYARGVS